jgi:4-hydroxy-tetrahydrodipicolinate reductase
MPALAIFGITGRMGQSLLRALRESPVLHLSGAVASGASARLGQDAAGEGPPTGVLITADASLGIRGAAVAVDFSLAEGVAAHATACAAAGIPLLVGATGIDAAGQGVLAAAARHIPVLIAPNTSVGVSMAAKLVSLAAAGLGPAYDVEIFETHHRMKRDAPSGTALALGEAVARARGQALSEVATLRPQRPARRAQPGQHRFCQFAGRGRCGRTHGDLCRGWGARRNHPPRHRSHHVRAGRAAGG